MYHHGNLIFLFFLPRNKSVCLDDYEDVLRLQNPIVDVKHSRACAVRYGQKEKRTICEGQPKVGPETCESRYPSPTAMQGSLGYHHSPVFGVGGDALSNACFFKIFGATSG